MTDLEPYDMSFSSRQRFTSALLAVAFASWSGVVTAQASSAAVPAVDIDLPAQPLSSALNTLSSLTGIQVFASGDVLAGVDAPALSGRMTVQQALHKLLAGSGLTAQDDGTSRITIRRQSTAAPTSTLPQITVTTYGEADGTTEGTGSYTTYATGAGTRLDLSLRETPQSVSVITRQQMDDQNLVTLNDVLRQTPGIVADRLDERVDFTSRGFALNTMIDGVPTFSFRSPSAEAGMVNTASYDRIEIVRGAAGLLNGVGDPGGSVNLVRKRPTPAFQGRASAGLGRWDSYSLDLDIGGPLNDAGTLRGRTVVSRTAGHTFIQARKRSDDLFYGILEADVAAHTTLSAGYEYQKTSVRGANFGQPPLFFSDGARTAFPRSFNPGTPWSFWDMTTSKIFLTLDHRLANGWRIKVDGSQLRNERAAEWGYLFEYLPVDQHTGDSTIEIRNNPVTSTNKTFDVHASGPIQALGREHRASIGLSINDYRSSLYLNSANPQGWDRRPLNFYQLENVARPQVFYTTNTTRTTIEERAMYGSARVKIADPVALILGARATWYEERSLDHDVPRASWTPGLMKEKARITPYAGVVVDMNKDFSLYASYTSIFQPTLQRNSSNSVLPPKTGQNYELGIKGEHFSGKLNTGLALFRASEKDLAVEDLTALPLPNGNTPYRLVKGAQSRGYELTVSGELAPGLQVLGGYTYFAKRDNTDLLLQPNLPQRMLRIAASYRLPGEWNKLTVGGSVGYQSGIYYDEANGLGRASQGSVTLIGLMARYAIDKQWSASVNIENIADKHYYSGLGGYNGYNYGSPRNAWLRMAYKF